MNPIAYSLFLLCFLPIPIFAQCQAGIPSAGNPSCIPPEVYHQSGNQHDFASLAPNTRWGAIAIGEGAQGGGFGTAAAMTSERQASRAASAQCRKQGSNDCRVYAYRERCVAVAWALDRYAVRSAANSEYAKHSAIEACVEIGGQDCRLFYASCTEENDAP